MHFAKNLSFHLSIYLNPHCGVICGASVRCWVGSGFESLPNTTSQLKTLKWLLCRMHDTLCCRKENGLAQKQAQLITITNLGLQDNGRAIKELVVCRRFGQNHFNF